MGASSEYVNFLVETLAPLGPVAARRMFGGTGLFADGLMFGLLSSDEVLYFKVDEHNQPAFEAEGMGPFAYGKKSGRPGVMAYWQVPERLFDQPDEFVVWARDAISVALRADAAKPPSQRKGPGAKKAAGKKTGAKKTSTRKRAPKKAAKS